MDKIQLAMQCSLSTQHVFKSVCEWLALHLMVSLVLCHVVIWAPSRLFKHSLCNGCV